MNHEQNLARRVLGWRLQEARALYGGFTVVEAAKRTGIPEALWLEYEAGEAKDWPPDEQWLRRVAELFDRHPGEVFGWASQPKLAERARADGHDQLGR